MYWITTFLALVAPSLLVAEEDRPAYPPRLPGAQVMVYKETEGIELKLYIFKPDGHRATDRVPVVVFFFGGGWQKGTPGQFLPQCEYLKSLGLVAVTADYRVASRHGVRVPECISDAKSAIRWI